MQQVAAVTTERSPKPLGFSEIKKWLRHRHPMILLDRITDHEPGEFLSAVVNVSGALDVVAGHFPERAIYPGTNLIQAFAQCGIVLFQMSTSPVKDDEITLIGSSKARFFKIVVPGDQILFDVRADRISDRNFIFSGKATVNGVRAAAFDASLRRVMISDLGEMLW